MIVLDAGVLIAYLDGHDAHHLSAETLLAATVDEQVAVNPLTLAEVLVAPARHGRMDVALGVLRNVGVIETPFPADAAVRLAQLRADTGLLMPDCCVLLAADATGAGVATFDDRLARVAEQRGVTVRR